MTPPPTVAPTATRPDPPAPTAAAVAKGKTDICQVPVPPGFQIRSDKGTFEDINSGFGVVSERVNYTETADKLAQSLYDNIAAQSTVFKEGVLTGSSDAGDRARRDFIGVFGTKPLEGPIEGTIFARTFGQTVCAVTVITYEGSVVPHAQTVAVAIAGLTVATTTTAPAPTAIAAGTGGVVLGQGGRCQMPVPPGFQVGADGDNFRSTDLGFGVVAEEANYTETAIFAAQGLYNQLVQSAIYTDVVLTGSSNESDRARRDFTGLLGTTSIQGTIFARTFGTTACAVTVITYQGAGVPHAQTAAAVIGGLTVTKP